MIKILFHIDTLTSGGAEKVLCNLVNSMDKSKFDITVQTLFPVDYQKYLAPGISYKYIYPESSRFYQYIYRVEAMLGLVYKLHMKSDYDIECAYLECGPTKVIASSSNKKAKKTAWVHCDFKVAFGKQMAESTMKYYKKYDRVVCVSKQCKQSFDELFEEKIHSEILYNVVDDEEIINKSNEPLPSDIIKRKTTLCTIGRFAAQKNYPRLLSACAVLKNEGYDFDLWILGDGEQRPMLEKMIDDFSLNESVFLLGFRDNPYPVMKVADFMVCSSNYEGFSTFITESVVLEKPILTTDCSGMQEILFDYNDGVIVENSDEAFCNGLRKVLDKNNFQTTSKNKRFVKKDLVSQNEKFFEELLN